MKRYCSTTHFVIAAITKLKCKVLGLELGLATEYSCTWPDSKSKHYKLVALMADKWMVGRPGPIRCGLSAIARTPDETLVTESKVTDYQLRKGTVIQ